MQKRCIRTINLRKRIEHTNVDFYNMKILKLNDVDTYFSLIFTFKIITNLINSIMRWTFAQNERFRNFNNLNLQVPFVGSSQHHLIIIDPY